MMTSMLGVRAALVVCVAGLGVSLASATAALQPGGAPTTADGGSGGAAGRTGGAGGAARAAEPMPIRRITLYRSGVGMFQREGSVSGNAEVSLRFNTEQINDILKSLVLLDLDGGRVESVSYSSKDPIQRRLASFGVDLSDAPSASTLLSRLRGSPVKLTTAEGTVSGTIMNVEERPTVIGGGPTQPATLVKLPWINLVTDQGVKSVNLTNVTGFELLDKKLAEELGKALEALAEYRADNVKSVDLKLSGPDQARRVVAAYVHETPVWKNSYRLVLGDSGGDPKKQVGALQGWAIVENTTDADWTNVRLALVAGRPVSFQMDLYEPLYMQRAMVPVPMIAAAMPRAYQAASNVVLQAEVAKAAMREYRSAGRKPGGAPGAPPAGEPGTTGAPFDAAASPQVEMGGVLSAAEMMDYAPGSVAQAGQAGETFFYEVSTPITIERQRSAMIPFLTANIPTRRVSIFNLADRTDHPMRGVEVTNPTDAKLQLLPGPISVFEGDSSTSAYAGDAQIGNIPAGDKRLLAYAVDLDVAVLTTPTAGTTLTKLKIVQGMVEQSFVRRDGMTYGFRNKDLAKGRTIVVEHPRLGDWTLVEPKEFSEKTQSLYRFELELKPDEAKAITVTQERIESQRLDVTSFDLPTILRYRTDGKVSDAVVEAFRTVAGKRAAIGESERALAQIDANVKTIADDQARIRQNMQTIDRTTDLYKRYATKLNEQESQLEKLSGDRAAVQKQLDERRADLENFLRDLTVE
jgi:hypothetical protein